MKTLKFIVLLAVLGAVVVVPTITADESAAATRKKKAAKAKARATAKAKKTYRDPFAPVGGSIERAGGKRGLTGQPVLKGLLASRDKVIACFQVDKEPVVMVHLGERFQLAGRTYTFSLDKNGRVILKDEHGNERSFRAQ
ncbi:MAG: hypothetical protein K8S55_06935 [Phycisphaerae bacterium]|nr:hypothetical protein [Phycisphaerae bacterium]